MACEMSVDAPAEAHGLLAEPAWASTPSPPRVPSSRRVVVLAVSAIAIVTVGLAARTMSHRVTSSVALASDLSWDDWEADDPAFLCGQLGEAKCANSTTCAWSVFSQCFPTSDLKMDTCKALGESKCGDAKKCEWREISVCKATSSFWKHHRHVTP